MLQGFHGVYCCFGVGYGPQSRCSADLGPLKSSTQIRAETLSPMFSLPCVTNWAPTRPVLHPIHPQSGGLVERFNRTLAQQLAIVPAKHQHDWDDHVPLVLMAYMPAVQDSTSCSPALLMLGREIRTPAEMMMGETS